MKKITKIEYQKKNKDRVNVYLDDVFSFGIDLNIMIKHSLSKNMELDDEFIEEILNAEEENHVYNYALNILSRSAKSEKQMIDKLKEKGYDLDLINNAIEKLKKQGYLDDQRFSEMYINSKINESKYGKRKIKEKLYEKGIAREIIDEKLKVLSNEDELQRAISLGLKKLKSLNEADKQKRSMKLINHLISKGFEYGIVRQAVSKLVDNFDELENYEDF